VTMWRDDPATPRADRLQADGPRSERSVSSPEGQRSPSQHFNRPGDRTRAPNDMDIVSDAAPERMSAAVSGVWSSPGRLSASVVAASPTTAEAARGRRWCPQRLSGTRRVQRAGGVDAES
jgi:hypothetical protein